MNRFMRSLFILAGIFSITACNRIGSLQSTPSPAVWEAEEYAVYRTILGENEHLCIASRTLSGLPPHCAYIPELGTKLINDFKEQNKVSVPLKPELDLGVTVIPYGNELLVHSDCEFEDVCTCDFQKVSRVGFNADLNKALVYWESDAPLAGRGLWFYLVKGMDGEWRIEEEFECWKS